MRNNARYWIGGWPTISVKRSAKTDRERPTSRASRSSGAIGMITWRQDDKELYFMTRNWEVMAVDVTTTPTLKAGTAQMLFEFPGPLPGNPMQWKNVSHAGQRFLFAMPAASSR